MRASHLLACVGLIIGLMGAFEVHAKVYRCKDAAGATIFSGTPCGGNAQELNVAMIGTDREVRQPESSGLQPDKLMERSTPPAATDSPPTQSQSAEPQPNRSG